MNPFKLFVKGGKYVLKGVRFVLRRPEMTYAALLLPGLGYAKAALILKQMVSAERIFSTPKSGAEKLRYVIGILRRMENEDIIDIGMTDGQLAKIIAALVPAVEGKGKIAEVANNP
jgi:hypothetical protein